METDLSVIRRSPLFADTSEAEVTSMLGCLSTGTRRYAKNEFLLYRGDAAGAVGMVLTGSVLIIREDFWGNRNILSAAGPGDLFAEAYACLPGEALQVSVVAEAPSDVLYLDVQKILTPCSAACACHTRLIQNLLSVLAKKDLMLTRKLAHLSQRTTREKLLSYLSSEALRQGASAFSIPFDRQQLADYLSVDRSAMSAELGRMRDEGLLTFTKNRFTLLAETPQ